LRFAYLPAIDIGFAGSVDLYVCRFVFNLEPKAISLPVYGF